MKKIVFGLLLIIGVVISFKVYAANCETDCGENNVNYDCIFTEDGNRTVCENQRKKRDLNPQL